jgi:hypothetical protein
MGVKESLMKPIADRVLETVAALIASAALGGCAGLTSERGADPNKLEGAAYFMPMKYFTLTVTKAGGKVTALDWTESAAFPDLRRAYSLRYTPHLIGKTTVTVEVGPSGLLGTANTTTTDSTVELAKLVKQQTGVKALLQKPADACAADGTFVFMFMKPEDAAKPVCRNVVISIERALPDGAPKAGELSSPLHINDGASVPGIFYRLNRPYIATASADGQHMTKLLFVPNESPNLVLPYGRTLFAANDGKIELTEGVLKKYEQANDGELVALLKFPASVLSAYFTAVGNVFSAFSAGDKNEVDRLANELKMDALRRKLDKCKDAAQKPDDDAWKTLQCDAIGTGG